MIDAKFYVFAPFLLFLDKAGCQAPAPRIDNGTAFLSFHRRVETQVLPTRQPQSTELLLKPKLLCPVFHQCLQFRQRFLDLGHRSRAVDELSGFRIVLLVGDDQREQRYGLSCAGRHLQYTVTPRIEGLLEIAHVGILFGVDARVRKQHRKITGEDGG